MPQPNVPFWLGFIGACLIALILALLAFQETNHG